MGRRELEKAKNQLAAAGPFAQDALFSQGLLLGGDEVASAWRDADKYVPTIRGVTAGDVQRVARKYFVPENCVTAHLVPLPSKGNKPAQPASPMEKQMIR